MKQTCILVMGMHRSGTSALTGLLKIMGVSLGKDLIDAGDDNIKGFFENKTFLEFNKRFLNDYHTPLEVINFSVDTISDRKKSVHILKKKINKIFKGEKLFAIKDPRITYIFDLYQTALSELNVNIVCVVPIRHPLEVAQSLNIRNNFSINRSLLMWVEHILLTEKITRQYPRTFLDFDSYLNNPKKGILLLSKNPSIKFEKDFFKQENKIKIFLDSTLKHNNKKSSYRKLPRIVEKILNIKLVDYDNQSKSFDKLFDEFNNYKELFYNQDLKNTAIIRQEENEKLQLNLKEIKETSTKLQKKALQKLQKKTVELEESKADLTQTTQIIMKQQQELELTKLALNEKDKLIAQQEQTIEETNTSLTQNMQTVERQQQDLVLTKLALNEKGKLIAQQEQTIKETNTSLTQNMQTVEKQQQDLVLTKLALNEKDKLIAQQEQTIKETNTSLTRNIKSIEKQQHYIALEQRTLNEKDKLIARQKQAIKETNENFTQNIQTIEELQQDLVLKKQALNNKDKLLQQKNKKLTEIKNQVEQLKDELVVIYTERGCEITRFIKKVKGHYK